MEAGTAHYLDAGRNDDQAAGSHQGRGQNHGRQGHPDHGSGPAPDVGRAALQLHGTAHPAHLGRPRDHGLRLPRRHRRAVRLSQQARHRRVRRRIVPDEPPGTHHRRQQQAAGQGTAPEQRLSGHGPPAPGSFLRRPPQRRGHPGSAGLREARRSLWGRRLPRRQAGRS